MTRPGYKTVEAGISAAGIYSVFDVARDPVPTVLDAVVRCVALLVIGWIVVALQTSRTQLKLAESAHRDQPNTPEPESTQ